MKNTLNKIKTARLSIGRFCKSRKLFNNLPRACDNESVFGYRTRNGAAGGNENPRFNRNRGDKIDVGADKYVFSDDGAVFVFTVVVAENRSAADVCSVADVGVADIGEVRGFHAVSETAVFYFHEIAYTAVVSDNRVVS